MDSHFWFSKIFRKICFDFHIPPDMKGVASNFQADDFIRMMREAGFEAICLEAKPDYGYSYYDTKVGYKHPGLKNDMMKEASIACHRGGSVSSSM